MLPHDHRKANAHVKGPEHFLESEGFTKRAGGVIDQFENTGHRRKVVEFKTNRGSFALRLRSLASRLQKLAQSCEFGEAVASYMYRSLQITRALSILNYIAVDTRRGQQLPHERLI